MPQHSCTYRRQGIRLGHKTPPIHPKKAFCGQLVEQDPDDEPASVLLERIKAEKAQQQLKPRKKAVKRKAATGIPANQNCKSQE